MSRARIILAVVALVASTSEAQERREDWPEGSAMHTMFVLSDQIAAATKRLDAASSRLVRLVAESRVGIDLRLEQAMAAQATAWKAFRDVDCGLGGAIEGGGSVWPVVHGYECALRVTETRTATIRSIEDCISAIDPARRAFAAFDCLDGLRTIEDHPPSH